jgi:hypothetical protein
MIAKIGYGYRYLRKIGLNHFLAHSNRIIYKFVLYWFILELVFFSVGQYSLKNTYGLVWFMVFNNTFNDISAISWRLVL